MPLLEGPGSEAALQFTLYLPLLGGAYFGRIFLHQKPKQKSKTRNPSAELEQLPYFHLFTTPAQGDPDNHKSSIVKSGR